MTLNDPKYDIRKGKLWHREGKYFVPDEEPVMILRGKDPVALKMIETYISCCDDVHHVKSATERLLSFSKYQATYPERTVIGCHNHVQTDGALSESAPKQPNME